MILLLLALVMDLGTKPRVREVVVDVIEVNHCHDSHWNHRYDQVVLWNWDATYRRHNVAAWYMVDSASRSLPTKVGDTWIVERWSNGGVLVRVRSKIMRTTWTDYDPEMEDRKLLEAHYRPRIFVDLMP